MLGESIGYIAISTDFSLWTNLMVQEEHLSNKMLCILGNGNFSKEFQNYIRTNVYPVAYALVQLKTIIIIRFKLYIFLKKKFKLYMVLA